MKPVTTRIGTGLVGAAAAIAAVTLIARTVGFLRSVVLGQTLGADCLGSAYITANAVPNVVFEVVAGGALAGAVVPLLAGAVARHDRALVRQTVSALTGWVLLVLVPAAAVVAIMAGPIIHIFIGGQGGCAGGQVASVATDMLVIFSLQIPIYGLTVVAQGTLQAHHRFLLPALAPLLSSVVVMAAYIAYWRQAGTTRGSIAQLSDIGMVLLAWGTTLGVGMLLATQLPGMAATRLLAIRPTLRFPPGLAHRARRLALAGLTTVAAQWLAYAVSLQLANANGIAGAGLVYSLAWTVFLLPWAVLALPIATSAFPRLATQYDQRDGDSFVATSSHTLRAVIVVGCLGAAGVAATAPAVANLMLQGAPGDDSTDTLAAALLAFAPGVLGYAVAGHISRILYARHDVVRAALLAGGGWLLSAGAALIASSVVTSDDVVSALAGAASGGMVVAGLLGCVFVRNILGPSVLRGFGRTTASSIAAGGCAAAAGWWSNQLAQAGTGVFAVVVQMLSASAIALLVFVVVMSILDHPAVRLLLTTVRRRSESRSA